jgi:hypothetical protein
MAYKFRAFLDFFSVIVEINSSYFALIKSFHRLFASGILAGVPSANKLADYAHIR